MAHSPFDELRETSGIENVTIDGIPVCLPAHAKQIFIYSCYLHLSIPAGINSTKLGDSPTLKTGVFISMQSINMIKLVKSAR